MIHILKAIYSEYQERKVKKHNTSNVWFDLTNSTIHIEGGSLTVEELYNKIKEDCKVLTAVDKEHLMGKRYIIDYDNGDQYSNIVNIGNINTKKCQKF